MATVRIWIHLVWTTKKRIPYLIKEIRKVVFKHIKENAKKKRIHIDFINGYKDHVHALISMRSQNSISEIAHLLKGESSYWINKNQLIKYKFAWQDEFYAASVCYSEINTVRDYIKNQENHHRVISFDEEYRSLLRDIGLDLENTNGLKPS